MNRIITFLAISSCFFGFSQIQNNAPWNNGDTQQKNSKQKTLKEVAETAETYFSTIDRNKKGSGLKPFKRWEYNWSNYLKEDGTIAPVKDLWKAWEEKKALNASTESRINDNSDWKPLGPYTNSNTYNATDLKQTGQGRINAIAVDPQNSNTYYIGSPAGGIWKSTDAGLNWTPLTDYLPQIGVSGIAIDPTDSKIIYIATGDDDASDSYAVGVWKSIDGGSTWNTTGDIPGDPSSMNEIYIDPTNSQTILVATSTGIQKSINGGTTWTTKLSRNIIDLKMKPGDSSTWYAVSNNTFYKSIDAGESFNEIAISELTGSTRLTMDVTIANPEYIYIVSAGSNSTFNGIYKSTDSGSSFSKTSETDDIFNSTQAWYDLALTVSSENEDIVYVGVLDVWKSVNGGDNFTQINRWNNPNQASYTHADIHFLRFIDGKFFAGTDGGIYVSSNEGSSFTDLTKNIAISQFYRISVSQEKLDIIAGGLQDNGGFGYDGKDWRNYHGADGMEGIVDPTNSKIFYGFTQYGGSLNISYDEGKTSPVSVSVPALEADGDDGGNWITPLAINKEGELYAAYSEVYKLDGNVWAKVSNNSFGGNLETLQIDPNDSNNMYVTNGSVLYKSSDRGVTFSTITFSEGTIQSVEISKTDSNTAWIVTRNDVFKTTNFTDESPSFTNITDNLPSETKTIIKHHDRSGNNAVYLGTSLGVYYINDDLTEWQVFDNGLPNLQIRDLDINELDSKLYAATYGRGIFSTDLPRILPANDIRMISINGVSDTVICGSGIAPEITVKNEGSNTVNNITINYSFSNGLSSSYEWSGSLNSLEQTDILLPELSNTSGLYTLTIEAIIDNDAYTSNNSTSESFIINQKNTSPTTTNTFENDEDELITQSSTSTDMWTSGPTNKTLLSTPNGSKAYNTYNSGTYPLSTIGYLVTECYDLSSISNPVFKFNMGFDIELDYDYLVVQYSKDQGENWEILGSASDPNWYNSSSTDNGLPGKQWTGLGTAINSTDNLSNATNKEYSYDLSSLASENSIIFRFAFYSDLYVAKEGVVIDDLVISGTLSTNDSLFLNGIAVYPNPSEDIFNINRNNSEKLNIRLIDITGKEVFVKKNITTENYQLDLSNFSKGIYLLNMSSNGKTSASKLILK